ncbi:MAG TPA: hypothetical protein VNI54_08615 [Thermoanaerobaculia bacterium]|nr:hypothetical protein [Thermoanaerobaculia bacterium]
MVETVPPPEPWRAPAILQAIVIFIATFAAYWSSLGNHYALDDQLVIQRNVAVLRGVSGIGEILTSHVYQSYFEGAGGHAAPSNRHYRPLPVMVYAVEQSLFGRTLGDEYRVLREEFLNPAPNRPPGELEKRMVEMERRIDQAHLDIAFERHFIHVLFYAVAMVVMFIFLSRYLLAAIPLAGFIATLLYALHPIHTEVVANLKSLDEIFSILFILATGIFVFEWDRTRKPWAMALAMLSLVLALLSKEYAVLAPALMGAALMLVRRRKFRAALVSVLPLLIPIVLYLVVRKAMVGEFSPAAYGPADLIIDPFSKLRTGEAEGSILATKIDMMDENLRLLVWPHPLSADYSYGAFWYRSFGDWRVWLSFLIHATLAALTFLAWRRRHVLAFAGIVYFAFMGLVQAGIGVSVGERLAFHHSLAFAILLGWGIAKLPRPVAIAVCVAIAIPYGVLTYLRNPVWKNDRTLFLTDVKTVPDATFANGKAGSAILNEALDRLAERNRQNRPLSPQDREFVKERAAAALVYLRKSVEIHSTYAGAWISIGIAHYYREEFDQSGKAFARAAEIQPGGPALRQYAANFHLLGTTLAKQGDLDGAREMFRRAASATPDDARYQSTYGATAFMTLRFSEARAAFEKAIEIDASNPQAMQGMAAAGAYDRVTQATIERPNDPQAFEELAAALERNPAPKFAEAAKKARETAARLRK